MRVEGLKRQHLVTLQDAKYDNRRHDKDCGVPGSPRASRNRKRISEEDEQRQISHRRNRHHNTYKNQIESEEEGLMSGNIWPCSLQKGEQRCHHKKNSEGRHSAPFPSGGDRLDLDGNRKRSELAQIQIEPFLVTTCL